MRKFTTVLSFMLLFMATTVSAKSNILIAYFSWGGNTEALANEIQRQTGADMFRIEPVVPYSTDYNTVAYGTSVEERDTGARPAIKDTIPDLDDYDYIFIGTPVWWMQDPMIIHTFMETPQYNGFAGKTVIPFCTYFSGTYSALTDIVAGTPNAYHLEGYGVRGASSYNTTAIHRWLERIGILDVVAGIDHVTSETNSLAQNSKFVYAIDGKLVNSNGKLNGLAKGLYVMNGHKFLVR